MPLTLPNWRAVVARKSIKSGAFKELDAAVQAYLQNQSSSTNLNNLREKWNAWNSKFTKTGKTYKNSDRYRNGCALDDIAALFRVNTGIGGGSGLPLVTASQLQSRLNARENRVLVKRTQSLIFQMAGPTNLNINMPLRWNLRTTGYGKQDAEVLVSLPIKVHQGDAARTYWAERYGEASFYTTVHQGGKPGVEGASASQDVLRKWTKAINDWWGNAAVVHHPPGGPESYYRLKFEFTFTNDASKACKEVCCVRTTGEAKAVNPNGTIDAVRWGAEDEGPGGPICHEVGHFLGCPDEYYTITYEGVTKNWGNGYRTDIHTVMNNPDERPQARHYRKMGQELAAHFEFDPNHASIILNVGLSLNHPSQSKHKLAGHIWDGV